MKKSVIGIDIGGSTTKIALVENNGSISNYRVIETIDYTKKREKYLNNLYSNIQEIIKKSGTDILGIGVSMLGLQMKDASGTLYSCNAKGFGGFNIRKNLQREFNTSVTVTNDLTAHALGEYYYGIGKKCERFLSIAMGTGIGFGVIIFGKPVLLFGGTSGDCGRMILDLNSKIKDEINIRGTAEALCGTRGIEYLAKKYYGESKKLVARDIITRARNGEDEKATRIMKEVGSNMGFLLANLSVIFFPQIIAITGGTTEAGPVLIDTIKKRFNELVGEFHSTLSEKNGKAEIDIRTGTLGKNAGIIGGAVPVLRKFL